MHSDFVRMHALGRIEATEILEFHCHAVPVPEIIAVHRRGYCRKAIEKPGQFDHI
jgi:hypothetical protein